MEEDAAEARSQAALARGTEDEVSIATQSTDISHNQPKRDMLDSAGRCHVSGIRRRASWELRSGHSPKQFHASYLPDFIPTLTGLLLFTLLLSLIWNMGKVLKIFSTARKVLKKKKKKRKKEISTHRIFSLWKEEWEKGQKRQRRILTSLLSSYILKWHLSLGIPTKYNYFHLPTKNLMSKIPIKWSWR